VARLWDWCAANGMKTKGHPLIWCEAVPDWLPQDRDELDRLIRRRMDDLAADFGPLSARPLDFVDFLNEPTVQPANFDNPLALWMRDLGPDGTAEMAYDRAAAFRPAERGILNHFLRDETYLELARRLIDGGRPIRAIGLQSHQHSGTRPLWMFQEETDRFAALGVPVHWTENSVLSGEARRIRFVKGRADVPPWPSTPEGEARQAEALVQQYTLLFGHPAVEAVTQWNFTDAASWLSAPSGLLDKDLRPKPAYRALHELIRGRWWTDADLVADRRGLARSRVFRGNYRLRVIAPDGAAERELDATVADSAVRLSVDLAGAPPSKRR
jgi:GH35 family endo-1,4-beta-xylanase